MTWHPNPLPTEVECPVTIGEVRSLGPDVEVINVNISRLAVGGWELTFEWLCKMEIRDINILENRACLLMFQRWPFGMLGEIDVHAAKCRERLNELLRKRQEKRRHVMPEELKPKTLHNSDASGATKNVPDIIKFGDPDAWQCLCKASSQAEGWMKSTKVMPLKGLGCLVQVTTQQRNPDGSYAVAEAVCFVPNGCVVTRADADIKDIVPSPTPVNVRQPPE